jgi:hypothetical protein
VKSLVRLLGALHSIVDFGLRIERPLFAVSTLRLQAVADGRAHRLAPYEKRVIELLRNSKDKRARRLAKKRVCHIFHGPPSTLP